MRYDVAVVGGGIMGFATAHSLLKRGVKRVVVLERYDIGHDRAASTDRTKAIRYEYAEDEMYSRMVGRSIELWRELQLVSGSELYVNCGVVCWGRGEMSHALLSYNTVSKLGVPIREVSPEELSRVYPQFDRADIEYATINPEGGFLRASTCVAAFADQIRRNGGTIREHAYVTGISEQGEGVAVCLDDGELVEASKAIFTVGAWGANVLPSLRLRLPLTANRQQVVYVGGLPESFAPGPFPVFLNLDHDFYGFPLDSEGLLKASIHLPGPVIDPNVPQSPDPNFTEHVQDLLRKYIPEAGRGPVVLERMCMYAMTPDEDFILDQFPGRANLYIGAGFSGHGFKFAPLIGEMLAALCLGEEPEFSLDPFAIARFGSAVHT
jgi:monomeric sarcosine oxidase